MISDKEFCIEYLERLNKLSRPKTKTHIEMNKIVTEKVKLSKDMMFNDEKVRMLGYDPVTTFVYTFIRDNQELFIKD